MAADQLKLYYWCHDTALFPLETGIQRVVRRLAAQLSGRGADVIPVGWDPNLRQIVARGTAFGADGVPLDVRAADHGVLFVPEIPLTLVAGANLDPIQLGRAYGLRTAALVHDLIPIKRASDYQPELVSIYRRYYRQFAAADLAFATTRYVASDLAAYLESEGLRVPPIAVTPLPAALPAVNRRRALPPSRSRHEPLRLLTVTTWEPRKNILGLLRAIRTVSGEIEAELSLDLVGRRGVFASYDADVLALAGEIPQVRLRGTVSDDELVSLYETCHASVYPSVEEGFGLPVGESLWLGRPCLCHDGSSMAEIAPGGGATLVDMSDEREIVRVLRRWAEMPDEILRLARGAIERPLRDWSDFAADVARHIAGLGSDAPVRGASRHDPTEMPFAFS